MTEKQLYGLIGRPLEHSFSKDYFTKYFSDEKINAEYRNFELPDIGDLMELLSKYPELRGLNVTSPYKTQVLPYCDRLTPMAEKVGAVNCLLIEHSGDDLTITGHNTDCEGFLDDIRPYLPTDSEALVLGTGGASQAVATALGEAGLTVSTVSRTASKASLTYDTLTPDILRRNRVIVNCTPLGMTPHETECPPLPYDLISPKHFCYDLVYNPCPTIFLKECARRGAAVKGGLGMLINQAVLSWKFWQRK